MNQGRLHIAQICSSRSWGGMEMYVVTLSEYLRERGHHLTVFCAPESRLDHTLKQKSIPTIAIESSGYANVRGIRHAANLLSQFSFDILQSHYSKDLWTWVPALRFYGYRKIPLMFIKHIGTQRPKTDPLHRWIYNRVDHTFAISAVIRDNLLATHTIPPERLSVLHHGVETRRFRFSSSGRKRIRQELGIGPEEPVIGIVGRLEVGKGYMEFLQMAGTISKTRKDVSFLVIGEPTHDEENRAKPIYDQIDRLGLDNHLILTGFRQDVPDLLSAMDIFAFPSHAEAFGLVLIEAMAVGLPVVSSQCDGVLDIVDPHETGLLVPPRDADALTRAVQALLADPSLRASLGRRGYQKVLDRFSLSTHINTLEQHYHQALTRRRSLYS